jgi:serine/threonine protein kinase
MRPVVVAGSNEYRLLERVATTALGSVHRALHVSSGRVVEVTLLERLADDAEGKRAFSAALPAIAALRHDSILPVESWGDADGVPSVVTPLPDAEPLVDRLATAWLPDRATAVRLLRAIAAAVDHAHRHGVVHGDLEPASILLTAGGSVLVRHFGLAAVAGATPLPGGTGLRHGSPAHVAPERFPAGNVGPAADVYAFAVVGWQLLTGRLPPGGGLARPAAEVLRRGLDRDPAARWATCGELIDALDSKLAAGVAAEPQPPAGPAAPVAPAAAPAPPPPGGGRLAGIPARTWAMALCGLLLLGVLGAVIVTGERPGAPAAAASRTRGTSTAPPPASLAPAPATAADDPSPTPTPAATATPAARPPTAAPVPAATVRPAPTPTPTPSASATASGLSISVSDANPRPGEQNVMVTGRGFDPAQQYVIYFLQNQFPQPLFGPASPNRSGSFSSPVQIPSRAAPGPAEIGACVYETNQRRIGACVSVQVRIQG